MSGSCYRRGMITRGAATRVWLAMATGAVGASMVLGACSSGSKGSGSGNGVTSSETPQQAVQTAVSKLASQSNVKMVLSLPITADQAKQLSAKSGDAPMSDQEATALTTGTVFLNVATGGGEPLNSAQAQTDPKNSLDLGLTIGNDTPLELIYVDQNLYARAQLQQLLTDVGQDPSKVSQFTDELNSLNSYVPGISELGKGNWVELTHAGLQSLSPLVKQLESSAGMPVDQGTLRADITKLGSEAVADLKANSTFTSTGGGKYTVTVNVPGFVNAVKPQVQSTLGSIPSLGSRIASGLNAPTSIPAGQTAVVNLSVSDDKLSQAEVDLNQFAGKNKMDFAVPLRIVFSSPGAPTAPSGATALDVSKLPALLGSLLGGSSSTSHATSSTTG